MSPKKNIDGLLRAYFAAFADKPSEVLLVLKTYLSMANRDNEQEYQVIKNLIQAIKKGCRLENTPPVMIVNGIKSQDEIKGIHMAGHCYVNSSRAEGWGLGIIDAMGFGKTVITSQYGGPGDFCNDDNSLIYGGCESFYFGFDHPDKNLFHGRHRWFEPSLVDMARCMMTFHRDKNSVSISSKQVKAFELLNAIDYRTVSSKVVDAIIGLVK